MRVPGIFLFSLVSAVVALPGQAAQVQISMLVESFDGCGCMGEFEDPIGCAACPEGVTTNHPDCDVYGNNSLDHQWKNSGWSADMLGDNTIRIQGYASQSFAIGEIPTLPCPNPSGSPFGSWDHWYIEFDDTASPSCGSTSRQQFDFEAARIAQGLPAPVPGQPGHFVISVRREDVQGTGDTSDITTKIWMALTELSTGSTGTSVFVDVLPVAPETPPEEGWQDVTVNTVANTEDASLTAAGMHLLVDYGPQGAFADCTLGERVTVWVDNLRYIYTAEVPDAETDCANGIDDDYDGDVDCDDTDCHIPGVCPGCYHSPVFDINDDGDVDQADFAILQACITGTGDPAGLFPSLPEDCRCMDVGGANDQPDNALDQQDLVAFEACASGPGIPADPACDD